MTYTDPGEQRVRLGERGDLGATRDSRDPDQAGLFDVDPRTEPRAQTQCAKVLAYIKEHGSITPRDAMDFYCYRLAARVFDLNEMGHAIKKTMESHDGGQHARYSL